MKNLQKITRRGIESMSKRVAIIGLDSVPPEMMFDKLLDKLPNIKRMYERGMHGNLETCHPPITVPAWMVMMTGKNPGKLGIYGFRTARLCYSDGYIVNSTTVKEDTVWQILAKEGQEIHCARSHLRDTRQNRSRVATLCLASSLRDRISSSQTRRS